MVAQHRVLHRTMKAALHLLYPAQCLGCGAPVAAPDGASVALCPDCWRETDFITGAACDCCGVPLPDDGGGGGNDALQCDDCLHNTPVWRQGKAAVVYDGTGRQLVLALKHGDRPDMAPHLAGWLARAAAPLIRPGMVVAPVPLHLLRLFRRRYNQAALLSRPLARVHGLSHIPDLLIRRRHTPAQDHRDRVARMANLQDALAVNPRRAEVIRGRPVLLVDDVMASGATMTQATEALQRAGAGPVFVAVLARAVKDH